MKAIEKATGYVMDPHTAVAAALVLRHQQLEPSKYSPLPEVLLLQSPSGSLKIPRVCNNFFSLFVMNRVSVLGLRTLSTFASRRHQRRSSRPWCASSWATASNSLSLPPLPHSRRACATSPSRPMRRRWTSAAIGSRSFATKSSISPRRSIRRTQMDIYNSRIRII